MCPYKVKEGGKRIQEVGSQKLEVMEHESGRRKEGERKRKKQ